MVLTVYFFLCRLLQFSFDSGDHLRSRIICGPFWGSFAVSGSFAVGDHLRYCIICGTVQTSASREKVQQIFRSNSSAVILSFTFLVMFLGKTSEIFGYIFSSTKVVELRGPTSFSGASRFAGSFSVDIWYIFDVIDSIQYRKLLPNLPNTSWL